jgi:hypothetical protein
MVWMTVVLFMLGGCTHVELPTVSGRHQTPATQSDIDVTGVNQGVESERVVIRRIPFPVDEYEKLNTMGDGVVKGTIALTYNGHTHPGRQTRLYLNPVTSYSNQWYRESYLAGHKMGKSDPRLFNYLKFTASNQQGEFAFYGVPAGQYYVVGTVKCDACGGKIVRIARRIRVSSSGTVHIDLTKTLP